MGPGHRDRVDLGSGGEAVGPHTGQQRKGPLETAKRPIRHPRMRLGSFGHGWKHGRIGFEGQRDHPPLGRGFRC